MQEGVDAANATLARPEQIKKFTIVEGDWLPSGDELTPTMKLKRKPIAEKYADAIEAMYAASPSSRPSAAPAEALAVRPRPVPHRAVSTSSAPPSAGRRRPRSPRPP